MQIYYFTKASVPRALDENTLQSAAANTDFMENAYHDVISALETAARSNLRINQI